MSRNDPLFYKWGGGVDPDFPDVVSAADEFLHTAGGDRIVDGASGAAVANLGHSLPGVGEVMQSQVADVSYLSLSHFRNERPRAAARSLVDLTPGDLEWAFFNTSGSEAIETAIKFARFYHHERGDSDRSLVVSRWRSYHGATLGALSAGGNAGRRDPYGPYLQDWPKVPAAYPYRWDYEGTPVEQAEAAAADLAATIRRVGPESVAAFVAEPVSGSSAPAAHPHPRYYEAVRRICDEYGVLFVADEVMSGFCRTGEYFACERFDVVPDLMAVGKGLSAGYAPISATVISDALVADLDADARERFQHGHTFAGHPVSAAVAAHVLEHYTDDLLDRVNRLSDVLRDALDPLASHPNVGEIRRAGLLFGVEFVADRATKRPFDPDHDVAERIYEATLDRGVYVYPGTGCVDGVAGDHCLLAPPLTASEESVRALGSALVAGVDAVTDTLPPDAGWDEYRPSA